MNLMAGMKTVSSAMIMVTANRERIIDEKGTKTFFILQCQTHWKKFIT